MSLTTIITFIVFMVIILGYIIFMVIKGNRLVFYVFIASMFVLNGVFSGIDSFNDGTRLQFCKDTFGENYTVSGANYFDKIPLHCQMVDGETTIIKDLETRIDYPFIIEIISSMLISLLYLLYYKLKKLKKARKR